MAGQLLKTSLEGKVNNLPSFTSEALLPLFEAVVNSIHAIEDHNVQTSKAIKGNVTIHICRDTQSQLNFEKDTKPSKRQANPKITGFRITDNGIGFNDENFESFETSDSTHKAQKGCKGIGRFFWLKAFDKVKISSVFMSGSKNDRRDITFDLKSGITPKLTKNVKEDRRTVVELIGFKKIYRDQGSAYKTADKIAQRILEHCLSYYIAGAAPDIVVTDDEPDTLPTNLSDLYKEISAESEHVEFKIKGQTFTLSHMRLHKTMQSLHNIVLCGCSRAVETISLAKTLGSSLLPDESGDEFVYIAFVTGDYLDKHVSQNWLSFDIPTGKEPQLHPKVITHPQIVDEVTGRVKEYLQEHIKRSDSIKMEKIQGHISNENPSLRAALHYNKDAILSELEPASKPQKIDEVLHKYKGAAEYQIREQSKKLLKTQYDSVDEVKDELKELTDKIEDFQKDELTSYMLMRKLIIDLLERKLALNDEGKYHDEDIVHDLIFPRKATSNELQFEDHNLWILDEKLVFHDFAASDKPLNEITSSPSVERPDVVAFAEIDEDRVARSVSILEFKKPERKYFDQNPVKQLQKYVRKVDGNKVKLPDGRPLKTNNLTRYYCYAICDINDAIRVYTEDNGWSVLKDALGYFRYNPTTRTQLEIIAFDKIVTDAKRRHNAFFSKLGIK